MGIRERTAQADWAEAGVSADAPLRVHAAYTASLAAQWQAAREFTPCKSIHPLYRFVCRLPRNHRSEEHWHPVLTWFDEPSSPTRRHVSSSSQPKEMQREHRP